VLPPSVSEVGQTYADLQSRIVANALSLLSQALRRGKSSPEAWRDAVQSIGERLLLLQVASASLADPYLNDMLEAQGADPEADTQIVPQTFADLADGGGSWLQLLVYSPNSVREGTPAEYWPRFQFVANSIVKTGLDDVGRSSVQTAMQARPAVKWYVRMLRGKTCARCAILSGRRYKSSVAFDRHRNCDCVHIPAAEDARSWTTDTKRFFRSLPAEEQDQVFTKAGAEAIRLGADPAQVVNAHKGVWTPTAYGTQVQATLEGTTKRGIAGQRLGEEGFAKTTGLKSSRYAYSRTPRLMPEEIFLQAERLGWDRTEVLRQLKRFGYVL
jgi:hypothetical protein